MSSETYTIPIRSTRSRGRPPPIRSMTSRNSAPRRVHLVICKWAALVYEGLHSHPAKQGVGCIDRPLLWTWGRSLIALFGSSRSAWQRKWSATMSAYYQFFDEYCIDNLTAQNCVYVRLSHKRKKAYAGMSKNGILSREGSRTQKFRQKGLTAEEPALTYWRSTRSYFESVPISLQSSVTALDAEIAETTLIIAKQTELNAPFIYRFLRRRGSPAVKSSANFRVWARARRLQRGRAWLTYVPSTWRRGAGGDREALWRTLHTLNGDCADTTRPMWNFICCCA